MEKRNLKYYFPENLNNKLKGKYFTTIRIQNVNVQKGVLAEIYTVEGGKEIKLGVAEIVDFKVVTLGLLNEFICGLDAGMNVNETRELIKEMNPGVKVDTTWFNFILLKYIQKEG